MTRLFCSSVHAFDSFFRQTPNCDGIWNHLQVTLDAACTDAEWLMVFDRHRAPLVTNIPKQRRILMVAEPPEFQNYTQSYLDQFGILCAPQPISLFNGKWIQTQTALPWFYGADVGGGGSGKQAKSWSDLMAPVVPLKARDFELTAICSTKVQTKNQVRRLRFLKLLKKELGDRLQIFGRGFERLDDKADIIDRSRYHLALENNLAPFGWTEKTADPILGGAFLIHAGAREIEQDFDADGLLWIDLTRPRNAIERIVQCLDTNPVASETSQVAMQSNKHRLMHEHNLFALLDRIISELSPDVAHIAQMDEPQALAENRISKAKRLFRMPRAFQRLIWQFEIALRERD